MKRKFALDCAALACLSIPVLAQAPINDDCASPITLPGPGVFAFDSSAATTGAEGQSEAACAFGGSPAMLKDLWYVIQANATGSATVTTCAMLVPFNANSRIAMYDGSGCPTAVAIGCDDNTVNCTTLSGAESTLTWPTTCGAFYTMQLAQFGGTYAVSGHFELTETGSSCGTPPSPFCFGDGTGTACPCGNSGAAGNGCASSVNASGAHLSGSGFASIAADSLVLGGSGMPNSACLFFQGTTQIDNVFGDGKRCAGGAVVRLGTKFNSGGASHYPSGTDAHVAVKGGVTTPGTRTYQIWYRNAAAFCTPSTFNLTNGQMVTWQA
jgi:hypothetical protein